MAEPAARLPLRLIAVAVAGGLVQLAWFALLAAPVVYHVRRLSEFLIN